MVSITITFCSYVADCSGNGSAITTAPLDVLYPGYQRVFHSKLSWNVGIDWRPTDRPGAGNEYTVIWERRELDDVTVWPFFRNTKFLPFQHKSTVNWTLMADCVLCFLPIVKHSNRNLVQCRGEFKVGEEKALTGVCCTFYNAVYLWTMCWTSKEATRTFQ